MTNGKICIGSAGGTLSFTPGKEGDLGVPLPIGEIIDYVPFLKQRYHDHEFEIEEIPIYHDSKDSMDWENNERYIVEKWVRQKQREGYAGVVVSQGTDSGQETAYHLSIRRFLDPFPVIITGAADPVWKEGSDAPGNLTTAYMAATDPRIVGVNTVMGSKVMRSSRVLKRGGDKEHYYVTPNYPVIARFDWASENKLYFPLPGASAQRDFMELCRNWAAFLTEEQLDALPKIDDANPGNSLRQIAEDFDFRRPLTDPLYFDFYDRFFDLVSSKTKVFDIGQYTTVDDFASEFIGKLGAIVRGRGGGGVPRYLRKPLRDFSEDRLVGVSSKPEESIADLVGYTSSKDVMKSGGGIVPTFDARPEMMQAKMAHIFAILMVNGYKPEDKAYWDLAKKMFVANMVDEVSTSPRTSGSATYDSILHEYGLTPDFAEIASLMRTADRKTRDMVTQRKLLWDLRTKSQPIQEAIALRTLAQVVEKYNVRLPEYLSAALPVAAEKIIPKRKGEKRTVLVVEDDTNVGGLYSSILSSGGYHVRLSPRADEVLEDIERDRFERPDMVVCDYKMPGMNGDEFLKKFYGWHPEVPSILLTGISEEEIKTLELKEKVPSNTTILIKAQNDLLSEVDKKIGQNPTDDKAHGTDDA